MNGRSLFLEDARMTGSCTFQSDGQGGWVLVSTCDTRTCPPIPQQTLNSLQTAIKGAQAGLATASASAAQFFAAGDQITFDCFDVLGSDQVVVTNVWFLPKGGAQQVFTMTKGPNQPPSFAPNSTNPAPIPKPTVKVNPPKKVNALTGTA
jgi:hypothetical protein